MRGHESAYDSEYLYGSEFESDLNLHGSESEYGSEFVFGSES